MADVIKSFVSTRRTFNNRRHEAAKNPTYDNCFSMARAAFALSLAKVRVLRIQDKCGHLLLNAEREVVAAKQALVSYTNRDPSVQQMSLGI